MNLFNLFKKVLKEENLPEGKKGILLLDIDDTLLKSDSSLLKIYRKLPTDKTEVALTSEEYAKEHVTPETKKYYDYRDFRDPAKVYMSIKNGAPLLNNLKVVDAFSQGGYDLGVLTARGCADAVRRAIRAFLKVRDKEGNLVPARIAAENIHCVNDDNYPNIGATDFERKKNVLKKYAKDYNYDYVYFIDDDVKNLNALKALKKSDPDIASRLRSIDAKKNMANPIKEEVLSEMAVKDVTPEVIAAINAKDYDKALVTYFNTIKNQEAYAGKKDTTAAFRHMLVFGIARTFSALEKKGLIPEGSTQEMKAYGIANVDKLVSGIDYTGNPDFVAKKRNITMERKKFADYTVERLMDRVEKYKKEGWTLKDPTPKAGHDAKRGDIFYVYMTRPRQTAAETVTEEVLSEMAVKDVSPDILSDINKKNYKDALVKYFNKIKEQKTYAKFDTAGQAYDQMRRYSLTRTFNALEKNQAIAAGTSKELKAFADNPANRTAVLNDLGGEDAPLSDNPAPEKEKAEKKVETKKDYSGEGGVVKKIRDRVAKYQKLSKTIEDYITTSHFVIPFAVDVRQHGEGGVPRTEKPRLTGIEKDNPYLTKGERYVAPMKEFRKNFIPSFIEKAAMKNLDSDQKRNLAKAETLGTEYVEATKNKIYGSYMVKFLNNVIMGLSDFDKEHKEPLDEKAFLKELRESGDFPYSDFVKLEAWSKTVKMDRDAKAETKKVKSKSSADVPKEVGKVKSEYISYLNALEKAIAEDKAGEFFSNPANLEIAYLILDPEDKPTDPKKMAAFQAANPVPSDKLSPTLKQVYKDRVDESLDKDVTKNYTIIRTSLSKLVKQRNDAINNKAEVPANVEANIETLAKKVIDATMDRLIAVDLIDKSANSGALQDLKAAAAKHEAIRQKYAKLHPETEKEKKNYDEFYSPEDSEKVENKDPVGDMYKAVQASIDKLPIPEMLQRKLQIPKTVNLPNKKYSDEEIKELYDALQKGDEELYNLIAEPKFRERRK